MSDPIANGNPSDYIDRSPKDAVEEYIVDQQGQRQELTLKSEKGRLSVFTSWCNEHDIESMADLQSEHLDAYFVARRERHDLARVTLRQNQNSLQGFLRWAANQQYCPRNLLNHIRVVDFTGYPNSHNHYLPPTYGNQIVEYHRENNHGSERHAMIEIGWSTGLRPSSIRSLDVDDIHYDEQYIELKHRPKTGTPLKNASKSERKVAIPEQAARAIQDWITRPESQKVTDNYGRRPLFPSLQGRRHQRGICNILRIRPYQYLDVTPTDMASKGWSDGASHQSVADDCPPTVSPYDLRKSVAVRRLRNGIAVQEIASQMDCSEEVLRKWDDQMNKMAEMEHHRDGFDAEDE